MFDLLRKTVYAAIGGAMLSKRKLDRLGEKMVREAEASESQGKRFVDEVTGRSGDERRIRRMIDEKVEEALRIRNLPSRTEMETLELRVKKLEKNGAPPPGSQKGEGI